MSIKSVCVALEFVPNIKTRKAMVQPSSDFSELAEQMAMLVCNPRKDWRDNILPPTKDTFHLDCIEVVEEPDEFLCQREFEQVQVDGGSVGDVFGWYYGRDVELSLVDAERRIEAMTEELDVHRDHCLSVHYEHLGSDHKRYQKSDSADYDIRQGIELRDNLDTYVNKVDLSRQEEDVDVLSMYTYMELYIDKFSLGDLAVIMDVLEGMRSNKEISWWNYVQCGLAVCYRLVNNCPRGGWDATLKNLRKHNNTNHTKVASYEDRFFGEMNFDMEEAVDLMAQARSLAAKCSIPLEDAFYSILDARDADPYKLTPVLEEV